jgi:hypothetical protein
MTKKRVPLWLKGLVLGIVVLHVALVPVAIVVVGNAIPIGDEWHDGLNADIAAKTARGQLNFGDLFIVYRGHRLPLTLGLTALNSALFGYDPRFEMLITALLLVINFCLMAFVVSHLLEKRSPRLFWLSLIPLAAMIFTGRWWGSWIMGLMNLWQFTIMFTLLGALIVIRTSVGWRSLITSALLCAAATFSHGGGVLAFGVVGWLLLARGERHIIRLTLFVSAALLCIFAIFLGSEQSDKPFTINPVENLRTAGMFLGATQIAAPKMRYGVVDESASHLALFVLGFGLLFALASFRYLWQRVAHFKVAVGTAFMLWGIGFALMVSITRFEESQANTFHFDHYTPLTMQFWLGSFLLGLLVLQNHRNALRSLAIFWVIFISGTQIIFSGLAALYIFSPVLRLDKAITATRECPLTVLIGNKDCEVFYWFSNEMVYHNAKNLAMLHLSAFANANRTPVAFTLSLSPVLARVPYEQQENGFYVGTVNGETQYVLVHRLARLAQALSLPDLPDYHFTLRGALSLESTCADQSIQARLIVDDGQTQRIAIEQTASTDFVPFAVDLTDLRGRDFTLLYELETPESLPCGHVLWANPRIAFSLKPQVP